MSEHPSVFELDVLFASTADERARDLGAIEAHVVVCAECRAHVDALAASSELPPAFAARLERLVDEPPVESVRDARVGHGGASSSGTSSVAPPSERAAVAEVIAGPVSASPASLASLSSARDRRASRRFAGVASLTTALALAAGIALFLRGRREEIPTVPDDESSYVGIKGVPAAQALVRRDGKIRVWDGASRLRPGDSLAIGLACEQFTRAAVYARGPSGGTKLWSGECPRGPNPTLPFTLVVDDEPGRERFSVVLSREPLDDARSTRALQASTRGADIWTIDFTFEKETR
jgi:hypothetical protein